MRERLAFRLYFIAKRHKIFGRSLDTQPVAAADHPPAIDMTYKNQHPPHYPMHAITAHHQGIVVLDVFVDAQSRVNKVEVQKSSGYTELDAAAAAAAEGWRFAAGVKNGEPYASVIRVPVTFSM